MVWWRPLQSLAGKCSDTTVTSKGGNGPTGPEDRGPEEVERYRMGRVGWVGVGGGEGCNLVILGGFVVRGVTGAALHISRGLSPFTAEAVRLREKW